MSVVSFKVSKETKEKMRRFEGKIRWAEELRRFVEGKIRELEAEENMRKVIDELEKLPLRASPGFSAASVREDRDSR